MEYTKYVHKQICQIPLGIHLVLYVDTHHCCHTGSNV